MDSSHSTQLLNALYVFEDDSSAIDATRASPTRHRDPKAYSKFVKVQYRPSGNNVDGADNICAGGRVRLRHRPPTEPIILLIETFALQRD